ncbi:hypothetical protein KSP39_PZI022925 [Platanthera zijinensis]|uniref:Plastid lipid-associated protein/fibrillin conserved domain-containing protein n=1 Tax=Platanthera zijinensis TaxID=2320716 RepID=A0AAP0FV36_9ASPA
MAAPAISVATSFTPIHLPNPRIPIQNPRTRQLPISRRRSPAVGAAPASQSVSSSEFLRAKADLLRLISDQERGLRTQTDPSKRGEIIGAIDELAAHGEGTNTTGPSLSCTWRMLWTTEKEQLFIIKNAGFFGTQTGDVLQVIDVEKGLLNNVITFPPSGVFFVRSSIEPAPPQRINFRYLIASQHLCFQYRNECLGFTSAVLRWGTWEIPLPPFGRGWFESVYMDGEIRVAKDIRGDYLVVDRAPYSWKE